MRRLLDNCVDRRFGRLLEGHEVLHAGRLQWGRLENGDLLNAAEADSFQVLVTVDRGITFQQNLAGRRISIVTLVGARSTLAHLASKAKRVLDALASLQPGVFIRIE